MIFRPDRALNQLQGALHIDLRREKNTLTSPSSAVRRAKYAGGWSNGKTADSDSAYLGSNPSPPAKMYGPIV